MATVQRSTDRLEWNNFETFEWQHPLFMRKLISALKNEESFEAIHLWGKLAAWNICKEEQEQWQHKRGEGRGGNVFIKNYKFSSNVPSFADDNALHADDCCQQKRTEQRRLKLNNFRFNGIFQVWQISWIWCLDITFQLTPEPEILWNEIQGSKGLWNCEVTDGQSDVAAHHVTTAEEAPPFCIHKMTLTTFRCCNSALFYTESLGWSKFSFLWKWLLRRSMDRERMPHPIVTLAWCKSSGSTSWGFSSRCESSLGLDSQLSKSGCLVTCCSDDISTPSHTCRFVDCPARLLDSWCDTLPRFPQTLAESMAQYVAALLRARGGPAPAPY